MKYYPRDPDAAIAGMTGLTLEQVGAYNLILDYFYARDGILPDNDAMIARMLRIDPRTWRRLKRDLMAAGKIRVTNDGLLTANGVTSTLTSVNLRSKIARSAANVRWENYRKAKQINDRLMPHSNASKIKSSNSVLPSKGEDSGTDAVDDGENFGVPHSNSTPEGADPPQRSYRPETMAVMRAKGWIE